MKKIIYNIAIVLAASCLFASCEDDNYDEPNSGIKGRFIDAETSEVVPMPVQGTSSIQIRMYERDRYYLRVMITRSFRLSRIPRSMGLTRTRGCSVSNIS